MGVEGEHGIARPSAVDGKLERILLNDDVKVGGERDSGYAGDSLVLANMERLGLEVGDDDIRDMEPTVLLSGGGVVLIDLEPHSMRGQRGEPEHEGLRAGLVGELGRDRWSCRGGRRGSWRRGRAARRASVGRVEA